MPRRRCKRYVTGESEAALFTPDDRTHSELAWVELMPDELESIRLADQMGLYQEAAAVRMQVSRATFSRILTSARAKVADALVNGKAIRLVPLTQAPDVMEDTMSHSEVLKNSAVESASQQKGRTICIPIAIDHGLDSKLLNHFGSAPLFAIVDIDARTMTTLDNSGAHGHGGCAPVEALAGQHVEAVIVGGIGSGAIRRLTNSGIRVFKGAPGSISKLIDAYAKGLLAVWNPNEGCGGHGNGSGSAEHGNGDGGGCHHES